MEKLILIGKILSTYKTNGDVKLISYTNNPLDIFKYNDLITKSGKNINITKKSTLENSIFTVSIKDVTSKEQAANFKGNVYVHRNDLPVLGDDEFYHQDLLGLDVFDDDVLIGIVKEVLDYGAGIFIDICSLDKSKIIGSIHIDKCKIEKNYITIDRAYYIEN